MGYQAVLIALSSIAITFLIPPFIWHIKTVNIPAITLIVWLLLMNIKIFVDAIIWGSDNFYSKYDGTGYCDVMIKLQVGANVGISSSVAGIMFNLYRILKADSVIPGLRSFKKIAVDLLISLLTPVVVMALNYLVQSRRYYIFQYSGCQNVTALSYVTIIIYTIWMVIWSLVGVIFSALIIATFFRKRKDVKDILRCTNSGLTLVRFAKLLIFCVVVILVMFPLSMFIFTDGISNVQNSFDFKSIHSKVVWFTVSYVPLEAPYYITWIYLVLSYLVFIFFGLGSDAIDMYISFLSKIGFRPIVEYAKNKRQQRRLLKADQMVSNVLGSIGTHNTANQPYLNTSTSGTSFDMEMQRIIGENDEKSPTSTAISNIFGDKHEIPKEDDSYRYFVGVNETLVDFDEDDINYLNMLYENDRVDEQIRENRNGSPSAASPSKSETDIGYVYTVQHRD